MAAATYVKFNIFTEDWGNKVHDLFGTAGAGADTLKWYLSNATPNVATHVVKADLAEIATGNGYTGPQSCANVGTRTNGVLTVVATSVIVLASGGTIGPFRYVIVYNSTAAGGPLIAYFDAGSAITLQNGETFPVRFNSGVVSGTLLTLQ